MKYLYIIFISFMFFSGKRVNYISKSEKQTNQFVSEFSKKLKRETDINLLGIGGSEIDGKCCLIQLQFEVKKILDQKETRILIVKLVNDFLQFINNKPNIPKYFVEYPVTTKSLVFSLMCKFYTEEETKYLPYIVKVRNNMISYFLEEDGFNPLKLIYSETFEEAESIVAEEYSKNKS